MRATAGATVSAPASATTTATGGARDGDNEPPRGVLVVGGERIAFCEHHPE
jgi:hypothetical protein